MLRMILQDSGHCLFPTWTGLRLRAFCELNSNKWLMKVRTEAPNQVPDLFTFTHHPESHSTCFNFVGNPSIQSNQLGRSLGLLNDLLLVILTPSSYHILWGCLLGPPPVQQELQDHFLFLWPFVPVPEDAPFPISIREEWAQRGQRKICRWL